MAYEDHLQKQIDRFAAALAALLGRVISGKESAVRQQLEAALETHTGSNLEELCRMDDRTLQAWFSGPTFDTQNRDQLIRLLHEMHKAGPNADLAALITRLIDAADHLSGAVSLERIAIGADLST